MHVVAGNGVQVAGQGGHQRFAFAGFHLGDLPFVQRHAADELHVEVAQTGGAHTGLPYHGEGLRQQVVEGFAIGVALAELFGLRGQLGIGKGRNLRLQPVNLFHDGLVALELLALAHREQL